MTSSISSDPSKAIAFAPTSQAVDDGDQPKAIPTPATATAPRGRIIDDSARGTIFWEAEDVEASTSSPANDNEKEEKEKGKDKEVDGESEGEEAGDGKVWGKPFSLEWISTAKVPFWKTRGLRNAWNAGREVKIARDGTELETGVGRRLVSMFGREEVGAMAPAGLIGVNPIAMGFAVPGQRGW